MRHRPAGVSMTVPYRVDGPALVFVGPLGALALLPQHVQRLGHVVLLPLPLQPPLVLVDLLVQRLCEAQQQHNREA
jgi:hypothetical protein